MIDVKLLPVYSQALVELVRAYDRADLAVRSSSWNYASLRDDDAYFVDGDDSLPDWANVRLKLLALQLAPMKTIIAAMIKAESMPWFHCDEDENNNLLLPTPIVELFDQYHLPKFHYDRTVSDGIFKAKDYINEYYVFLFEGDGFILPRTIPRSIVEIWWRRQFHDMFTNCDYSMALAENPEYGWDCYGHEL